MYYITWYISKCAMHICGCYILTLSYRRCCCNICINLIYHCASLHQTINACYETVSGALTTSGMDRMELQYNWTCLHVTEACNLYMLSSCICMLYINRLIKNWNFIRDSSRMELLWNLNLKLFWNLKSILTTGRSKYGWKLAYSVKLRVQFYAVVIQFWINVFVP